MLLPMQSLMAAHFTGEDEPRAALTHIRIRTDGVTEALNGHVLIRVTDPAPLADADYPVVPGVPDEAKDLTTSVYVPAAIALRVAASLRTMKKQPIPVLRRALIRASDTTIYLATTDLEHPSVIPVARQDITFPNTDAIYAEVARRKPKASAVGLSATYLALVAKVQGYFDQDRARSVKVTTYGPEHPVTFEWGGADGPQALAIVMPVRL